MQRAQRRDDMKLLRAAAESMLLRDKLNAALECVSSSRLCAHMSVEHKMAALQLTGRYTPPVTAVGCQAPWRLLQLSCQPVCTSRRFAFVRLAHTVLLRECAGRRQRSCGRTRPRVQTEGWRLCKHCQGRHCVDLGCRAEIVYHMFSKFMPEDLHGDAVAISC